MLRICFYRHQPPAPSFNHHHNQHHHDTNPRQQYHYLSTYNYVSQLASTLYKNDIYCNDKVN